jgi:putative transposon-encoded protein
MDATRVYGVTSLKTSANVLCPLEYSGKNLIPKICVLVGIEKNITPPNIFSFFNPPLLVCKAPIYYIDNWFQ